MGKSKDITDKEIVIVDGKPMWKDDYKKIAKKEKNAKFIAFYTLTNNYSKDVTLTIVKVTKNPTDGIYYFNDCSQYDEASLLRKEYFSHYEYNRSTIDCNNSHAIQMSGCDEFWEDEEDSNEINAEKYVIYDKDCKGIIDVEKTIQNINNSFNTDMEIIESWSTIDFHRNFCYKFCDKEQLDYYLEVEILGELTPELYYDVETYLANLSHKNKKSKIKDLETYKLIKV